MHENVTLGGPVWWFASILLLVTWLLAVFVFGDSLRERRAGRWKVLPEPRLFYTLPQGIYVIAAIVAQFPFARSISAAVLLLSPLFLAQQIAYMLRVVYPKPDAALPLAHEGTDAGGAEPANDTDSH